MLVLPEHGYCSPNKAALYLWPGRPRSDTPQKWTVKWPARLTCDDGAQSQSPTYNPRAPPGDGFWVGGPQRPMLAHSLKAGHSGQSPRCYVSTQPPEEAIYLLFFSKSALGQQLTLACKHEREKAMPLILSIPPGIERKELFFLSEQK